MKIGSAFLLAFLAASIEATLLLLPLTLLVVVYFSITNRSNWTFLLAIVAGVLVDSLTFRPLGASSLFFLLTIGAIFLYGRKFETDHMLFGIIFTTLASFMYAIVFTNNHIFFSSVCMFCLACLWFGISFLLTQWHRRVSSR